MTNNILNNWDGTCYHSIKHADISSRENYKKIKHDGYLKIGNISIDFLRHKFENPFPNIIIPQYSTRSENEKYLRNEYRFTDCDLERLYCYIQNINKQSNYKNKYTLYGNIPNYFLLNTPSFYSKNEDFKRTFLRDDIIVIKFNLLNNKDVIKPDIDWFKFEESKNFPKNNYLISLKLCELQDNSEYYNPILSKNLIHESNVFCINKDISLENTSTFILKDNEMYKYE